MFPLRDVHRPSRTPIITRLLVLLNIAAFAWQFWLAVSDHENMMLINLAVRPNCYFAPGACGIALPDDTQFLWQPLLTSMFLHGGLLHIAGNMWFLWVFGPAVEDRMGRVLFPLFYLVCGICAALFFVVTHPYSNAPLIGASGAIAGVLGAHLVLYPKSWILTYLPPIWVFPVPSLLFLALWIAMQVLNATFGSPMEVGADNVAWMAHVGGFATGALWAWRIKPWWKNKKSDKPKMSKTKA